MIDLHKTLKETFDVEGYSKEDSPKEIYKILKEASICNDKPLLGMAPKKGILGLKYDDATDSIVDTKPPSRGGSEDLIDFEEGLIDFGSLE